MTETRPLKVALLGCGNVGSEVYRLIGDQAADLAARVGAPVQVAGVAVRRPGRTRGVTVDPGLITTDAPGLVSRDDIDIVVEVIGGIEPARSLLLTALRSGKAVVTANKALLAEDGMTLHDAARAAGGVSVRVRPAMIPRAHPLAGVREAYNAVFVEAESAGRLMFYGAGAGGVPTASAVLGDIVAVARNRLAGTRGPDATTYAELPALPMGQALTRYHISLDVADKPGVLARVAEAFARHDVSIKAVRQEGRGDDAQLVIVTHAAPDAALAACVADLGAMDVVRAVASVMRVEGENDE